MLAPPALQLPYVMQPYLVWHPLHSSQKQVDGTVPPMPISRSTAQHEAALLFALG